jgi:flagellar basal body-associated protein FliL
VNATKSGGARGILIAVIVVVALAIVGLLVFFVRRGRSQAVEQ